MSQSESVEENKNNPSQSGQQDQEIPVNRGDSETDTDGHPGSRDELEERLRNLEAERDELKEKYLRKVADLDNLRKRKQEEQEKQKKYANKNLLEDLLEVIDNFDRALESMDFESGEVEDGIRMIRNQLGDLLGKYQVEKIDAEDQPFDPNYHEGMMQEERDDLDEKTVLEVFQEGYVLHDRVLRPAQVKVGVPGRDENPGDNDEKTTEDSQEESTFNF